MNRKICCIKLSLAARVIAMVGLAVVFSTDENQNGEKKTVSVVTSMTESVKSYFFDIFTQLEPNKESPHRFVLYKITSVLVLTQLFTDFYEPDKKSGTVSILLGLDIDEFSSLTENDHALDLGLKIGYMFFALLFAVASAILIWGSIVEINYFAFPWMVCGLTSFFAQIATIVMIATKYSNRSLKTENWIILLSICNLCVYGYFLIVVFYAQKAWTEEKNEERENITNSIASSGNVTIQDSIFEHPAPPLPSKNHY